MYTECVGVLREGDRIEKVRRMSRVERGRSKFLSSPRAQQDKVTNRGNESNEND